MLTTLPLEAFVCRSVMLTYYFPDEPFNMNRHLLFTTALVLSSMLISLITCDLGAVFELIGATSAAALAYIFPPLCYVKLSTASRKEKIPAYLCITFGIIVMGVSLLQVVVKMIKGIFTAIVSMDHKEDLLMCSHPRRERLRYLQLRTSVMFESYYSVSCISRH